MRMHGVRDYMARGFFRLMKHGFSHRPEATTCAWCDRPATRQERHRETKVRIGACSKHADKLKPTTTHRGATFDEALAAHRHRGDDPTHKLVGTRARSRR